MTANSALSQNWVGCTVRTPKTQVAHTLRVQCPSRGRCCAHNAKVTRMSRAQPAQAVRSACAGRAHNAQVAGACRDLPALPSQPPMSRRHFDVATSRQLESCRDIISVSRHRLSCPASSQVAPYVATSISCRDLLDDQPMSRRQPHVATS